MADRRRRRNLPQGASQRERHGWLRFDAYQGIHQGALERHSFVIEDETIFTRVIDGDGTVSYALDGAILCQADIVIEVTKLLEVRTSRRREQVRGVIYRYNAHRQGGFNILRYDNQHTDAPDEYHRHEYDPLNGSDRSRTLIERQDVPTLIEVVSEVEALARSAGLL